MDRNTIIGLVLIMALVISWSFLTKDDEPPETETTPQTEETVTTDPTSPEETPEVALLTDEPDTLEGDSLDQLLHKRELENMYGSFGPISEGEEELITVETDMFTAVLNTKGAEVQRLTINPDLYVAWDSTPLHVRSDGPENRFGFDFVTSEGKARPISTDQLYFQSEASGNVKVSGTDTKAITFVAPFKDGKSMKVTYTFYGDKYDYDTEVNFDEGIKRDRSFNMFWSANLDQTEKSMKEMRKKTSLMYKEGDDVEDLGQSEDRENVKENRAIDWVGFKSQFFSHTLLADQDNPFKSYELTQTTPPNDNYVRKMEGRVTMEGNYYKMSWFAGPLQYQLLNAYDRKLEKQIDLGWGPLRYVNTWVIIPIFKFLEGTVGNYGIIILILAFFIKLVVFPMTYKSYISMAKMRVINETPEIKALDEKYKDDATKLQSEKMSFYRKVGVSPFGGCLPMLLQYPILISMFFFFPNSIELRQEGFLWANDLSTYDSILDLSQWGIDIPAYGDHVSLFTLLMAVSLMAFTLVNQKSQASMGGGNPIMKYMPYFMPIMLLVFLNNYAAGLSYYYLLSNIISVTQTMVTKRFIDDEKLLAQLREKQKKRGKNGKKSRMEQWMEKQQKKQKDAMSSRKGNSGNRSSRRGNKS